MVAIGASRLQKMEEVMLAAAYCLCWSSGRSTVEVHDRMRSAAGTARGCYNVDGPLVEGVGEANFAAMMFLDDRFLLKHMVNSDATLPVLRNRMPMSTWPNI